MHRLVPSAIASSLGTPGVRTTGAVLVIDARGSTALSAQLEPHGDDGAEALADLLAAVFAPMVRHVVARGGFVAEFAGDGIVAVFPGSLHEAVAAAADTASAVIEDLRDVSEITTPVGPIRLVMRHAIGAGDVEWRIWDTPRPGGGQRAAYAVLGSAVTEALGGEIVAPPGAIAAGPTAASHLPAHRLGDRLDDTYVVVDVRDGAAPSRTEPPAQDDSVGSHAFYPVDLAAWEGRGEFRDVVTVFVEFRSVPDVGEDSAMAMLLGLLAEHRGYLCNVTRADAASDGVRALALWGAPRSREHDIGYALRFLEDLRHAVGAEAMRAAATRSSVYAGFIGGPEQESYTAIGYGVNLAARMCARTPWGDIRVDEHIAARLDPPWNYEDLGPIEYRGIDRPIRTHRMVDIPPMRAADPVDGAVIGRRAELDRLEDLLAPLWSGRPAGTIAVTGEPGIGKSRLIAGLRARLDQRSPPPVWLSAQADEIRTQPFATLRDALASYFGRPGTERSDERLSSYVHDIGDAAPDLRDDLVRGEQTLRDLLGGGPGTVEGPLDPRMRFENLVLAVEGVVAAVEHTAPVIVEIRDAHWIDSGTAEVIERLRTDLGDARLAIITETRDPTGGLTSDHRIAVGPLDRASVGDLAEALLGDPPSEETISWLAERSEGNPYFVRHLVDVLRAPPSGEQIDVTDLDDTAVPPDLRRALVARLDRLPTSVRRLLQTASVLGRDVDLDVLRAVIGDTEFAEGDVDTAVELGAWQRPEADHVVFASMLVRDAAYGMLLQVDRRAIHGEAARAIASVHGDGAATAAVLAHHHDRAGSRLPAIDHYLIAARSAATQYANAEALAHVERALVLLDDDEDDRRYELLTVAHDVHDVLGDREAQRDAIDHMDRITGASDVRSHATALLRARLLAARGDYDEADRLLSTLDAERVDGSVLFLRAQLARYRGATGDARSRAEDARRRYLDEGSEVRVAAVDDFLGGIAYELGAFDEAAELHRRAAGVFAEHGAHLDEIRALNNHGTAIFALGDYSTARDIHETGAGRSREIGYRMGEGDHLDNVGGTAWAVGDYDLAIERYSEALAIRRRMDDAWGIAISTGNLAATRRALGACDEALEGYRAALEVDRSIGRRRGEAYDLHGIGLCHLDMERHNLAVEALEEAVAIRRDLGEDHLARESLVASATAQSRRGDRQTARAIVEAALADEGTLLFDGAVETTATILRCVEVLEAADSPRAADLRAIAAERVRERAERISDPVHRASYLGAVESHRAARPED